MVSYILLMREKLNKMRAQAQVNLEEPHARQKVWYDRSARSSMKVPTRISGAHSVAYSCI